MNHKELDNIKSNSRDITSLKSCSDDLIEFNPLIIEFSVDFAMAVKQDIQ